MHHSWCRNKILYFITFHNFCYLTNNSISLSIILQYFAKALFFLPFAIQDQCSKILLTIGLFVLPICTFSLKLSFLSGTHFLNWFILLLSFIFIFILFLMLLTFIPIQRFCCFKVSLIILKILRKYCAHLINLLLSFLFNILLPI